MRPSGYATTNVGRRDNNEDRYRVVADLGLFAVADGMGGYEGGEIASLLAIDTVCSFFRRVEGDVGMDMEHDDGRTLAECRMEMAFRLAHREVCRRRNGALSDMGSTLSVLLVRGRLAVVAHVGDSRIYRYRNGELRQLTVDHSLIAAMEAAGLDCSGTLQCYAHVITRAIGASDEFEADVTTIDIEPGDLFLLCSDGLTDVVSDDRIAAVLNRSPVPAAGSSLVDEALRSGAEDNVTAVVVQIPEP